jgi:hypothetical protein
MTCACGCGREISGIRARAANAMAGQLDPLVALLTGAAAEGVSLGDDDVTDMAELAAEGRALLEVLTDVLHGRSDRDQIDKRALRAWTGRATSASTQLAATASSMGFQGPATRTARLAFAGRRVFGRVTRVEDTGTTVNNRPRVRVEVEIPGEDGRVVTLTQKTTVSRFGLPRVGENVEVGYDPADPDGYVFRVASPPLEPGEGDPRLDRLRQLGELRDAGVLTSEEFAVEKARVLAE